MDRVEALGRRIDHDDSGIIDQEEILDALRALGYDEESMLYMALTLTPNPNPNPSTTMNASSNPNPTMRNRRSTWRRGNAAG